MTQNGYSNAIVNGMLGWLKGLASWVLRLFNLSGGFSPLRFLANNWLKLLVLLLIVGVAADLLIWLIRWRPHWVWFHKKRVIINDKNFFAGEDEADDEDEWRRPGDYLLGAPGDRRMRNWQDNDFVVAGEARRHREERARRERERRQRREESERQAALLSEEAALEGTDDVFTDGMFNVNAKQRFSDRYEDEVFSVSNLPSPEGGGEPARRREGRPRSSGAARGGAAASKGRTAPAKKSTAPARARADAPARSARGGGGHRDTAHKRPRTAAARRD